MSRYNFRLINDSPQQFPEIKKATAQEYLTKWNMISGLSAQEYSFDTVYKSYLMDEFVTDFFSCPAVTSTFKVLGHDSTFKPMEIAADIVRMTRVSSTLTTLDVFDKLSKNSDDSSSIVRKVNGSIKKCFDDFYTPYFDQSDTYGEPMEVGNELRKLFMEIPDSELENPFTKEDSEEFLVKIFSHLVLGGSLCQYDDNIQPYLTLTKNIYKDLVVVHPSKNNEKNLEVLSSVIRILSGKNSSYEPPREQLFPKEHLNNFCYLIVNPVERRVKTIYHHA